MSMGCTFWICLYQLRIVFVLMIFVFSGAFGVLSLLQGRRHKMRQRLCRDMYFDGTQVFLRTNDENSVWTVLDESSIRRRMSRYIFTSQQ